MNTKNKRRYSVAVLAGDGIGPEIMQEAIKVLKLSGEKHGIDYDFKFGLFGGAAYDLSGKPYPEDTKKKCAETDAVLLGSVGGSKWDELPLADRPEIGGLLELRKSMQLYANLRPLYCYKELADISPLATARLGKKIDLVIVRELAGGIYFSKPKQLNENLGLDTMQYDRKGVERIAAVAFELALSRKGKITSVDKANVLNSSMLWRKIVKKVALDYPEVEVRHMYVDNVAMQLVLDPQQFDVILTTNLFGDILSDEAAALAGSLGLLPSASFGAYAGLYEPAGGSAPDIAGLGIANPIAMILCAALMLEYSFHEKKAAREIFRAVRQAIKQGIRTRDIAIAQQESVSTQAMGNAICECLVQFDADLGS